MRKLTQNQQARNRALIEALIDARRQAHITQRQLAARLARAHSFVARIETGTQQLRAAELFEYVDALNVDLAALVGELTVRTCDNRLDQAGTSSSRPH